MIGRTGDDSFLFVVVISCLRTLDLWDRHIFGHALCQMVAINSRHQRQLGGVQGIECKASGRQFVMSTVGAVQGTVSRRKKVKIIFIRTILQFSRSVELSKL